MNTRSRLRSFAGAFCALLALSALPISAAAHREPASNHVSAPAYEEHADSHMILTNPMPFKEALQVREIKTLLPTTGRTADFARVDHDIKLRSMYSASVESAEILQSLDDLTNAVLTGQMDLSTARLKQKALLERMGYQPDEENRGGLLDLSSTPRINVQLETNVDVARGAGWYQQGQDPLVLDAFPAQELVRFFATKTPRGSTGRAGDLSWPDRWSKVGGRFYDGRMIALKSDPVWEKLGDPGIFPDGLGNRFAPFAFGSGMDTIDIDREEAASVGLEIPENLELLPQPLDLNADLQAVPDVRAGWLRQMLEDTGLGEFRSDGVFAFKPTA